MKNIMHENQLIDATTTGLSVTELQSKFPNLPPRVLVALAVLEFLGRTVTPFRLCECGCGVAVHGKARLDTSACRKRVQRQRDALAVGSPKQFNLVIQDEIPVPIPFSPKPRELGSALANAKETLKAAKGHWPADLVSDLKNTIAKLEKATTPTTPAVAWNSPGLIDLSQFSKSLVRPTVKAMQLADGSALYLPHSDQVIFYDKNGWDVFGWDWSDKYAWIVTGTRPPERQLVKKMLAEFYRAQQADTVQPPPSGRTDKRTADKLKCFRPVTACHYL